MQIEVLGSDGSRSTGQLNTIQLSVLEKILSSTKNLLIFLALAAVTAFIPILHFVLVPAFVLAGIFLAARNFIYRGTQIVDSKVKCPYCSSIQILDKLPAVFPIKETCGDCRRQFRIELS